MTDETSPAGAAQSQAPSGRPNLFARVREGATDAVKWINGRVGGEGGLRGAMRPVLMIGGVAVVAIGALWWWLSGGRYVSTDDAYVRAAKLMVAAEVSGRVQEVDVVEGQAVEKGAVLFRIDPVPFQIALDNAKAQMADAVLAVEALRQEYRQFVAQAEAQRPVVVLAQTRYERGAELYARKFLSKAGYDQLHFDLEAAKKTLLSLEQQAQGTLAKLGGNPDVEATAHPIYLRAKANMEEAQRQLDQTVVRAPFAGIATQVASLQPGAYLVSSLSALASTAAIGIISTEQIWVEANLKETDLTYVKKGDAVSITVDTYPDKVWTGKVDAISAASGAEFSLLPSTNTSGNWVKVVQRIPVRVAVQHKAGDPVLRSGMSAIVEIDTGHTRSLSELF